ncbi:MAG: helix-turn-helix transcriptional regulator [Verrucomicrobiota bacterium]
MRNNYFSTERRVAMKPDAAFGNRLKSRLEEKGVGQAELCEALGLSHGAVHHYLKGRVPRGYTLAKIARYLRTTADDLLGLQGSSQVERFVLWPLKAAQESLVRISQAVDQTHGSGYSRRVRDFVIKELSDAAGSVDQADLKRGKLTVQVEHKTGITPKGFPSYVDLVSPDSKRSAEAFVRFLGNIEEREFLFACIEPKWRTQEFFDQLITTSAYALCHAGCQMIVLIHADQQAEVELQRQLDQLALDAVVTAHEDFLFERDRLRMFYPKLFDFASGILQGELARRLKLDYKPKRVFKRASK